MVYRINFSIEFNLLFIFLTSNDVLFLIKCQTFFLFQESNLNFKIISASKFLCAVKVRVFMSHSTEIVFFRNFQWNVKQKTNLFSFRANGLINITKWMSFQILVCICFLKWFGKICFTKFMTYSEKCGKI